MVWYGPHTLKLEKEDVDFDRSDGNENKIYFKMTKNYIHHVVCHNFAQNYDEKIYSPLFQVVIAIQGSECFVMILVSMYSFAPQIALISTITASLLRPTAPFVSQRSDH